jgi:Na+(H+)/acetate symporter ActP
VTATRDRPHHRGVAAIFVSFTYVVGQMRGVGIVFSRFLNVGITGGVAVGMASCCSTPCSAG